MVPIRFMAAFLVVTAASSATASLNLFKVRDVGLRFLRPRAETVTIREKLCEPGTPVPAVQSSETVPPVEPTPYGPYPPAVPVVTSGGGTPGFSQSTPVAATTSASAASVPVTAATPEYSGYETPPYSPMTSSTTTDVVASTVSSASTTASLTRLTTASSSTLQPSTTTAVPGAAAATSVNVGVLGLVALAALHQVY